MIYGECRKEGERIHQCTLCKHRIYGCEEYEKQMVSFRKPVLRMYKKEIGNYYVKLDKILLGIETLHLKEA